MTERMIQPNKNGQSVAAVQKEAENREAGTLALEGDVAHAAAKVSGNSPSRAGQ
jgi:hypothetical protein